MRPTLTQYLFILNTALLGAAVLAIGVLWFAHHQRVVQQDVEDRALTMAESVAHMPEVQQALTTADPSTQLAPLAETLRETSGFEYIVVADEDGIRQSHPLPEAIGQPSSTNPSEVLAGQIQTGVHTGPAGTTFRARVPIYAAEGEQIIGYVSAGILSSEVQGAVIDALPVIVGTATVVLVLGALGALLISQRIRTRTRGLEPEEITELLEGREALLYAISEGVLAADHRGRLVLANEAAQKLLGITSADLGKPVKAAGLPEELAQLLGGQQDQTDGLVAAQGRILTVSARRVTIRDTDGGTVLTLRDQTQLTALTDELDGARTVTRGLRAQRHEFANRIHTVAGMLELGAVEEAKTYLTGLSASAIRANAEVAERIPDVVLNALVLAKSVQAAEQGTTFEVSPMSQLQETMDDRLRNDVLLVLGNLVDNALEATGEGDWVELFVRQHPGSAQEGAAGLIEIRVTDSGPGVPAEVLENIFSAGFSTKDVPGTDRRGLGLALVRQTCRRWSGDVTAENLEHTVFTAHLLLPGPHEPGQDGSARVVSERVRT